jgi:hypothetical protein
LGVTCVEGSGEGSPSRSGPRGCVGWSRRSSGGVVGRRWEVETRSTVVVASRYRSTSSASASTPSSSACRRLHSHVVSSPAHPVSTSASTLAPNLAAPTLRPLATPNLADVPSFVNVHAKTPSQHLFGFLRDVYVDRHLPFASDDLHLETWFECVVEGERAGGEEEVEDDAESPDILSRGRAIVGRVIMMSRRVRRRAATRVMR